MGRDRGGVGEREREREAERVYKLTSVDRFV